MTTATSRQGAYKVVKSQRGLQGKWFLYPTAATFDRRADAEDYARHFAAEQRGVAGTRILVVRRGGGPVLVVNVE